MAAIGPFRPQSPLRGDAWPEHQSQPLGIRLSASADLPWRGRLLVLPFAQGTLVAVVAGFLAGGAALAYARERALHSSVRHILNREFGGFPDRVDRACRPAQIRSSRRPCSWRTRRRAMVS